MATHTDFLQHWPMLHTPCQALRRTPPLKTHLDSMTLHKDIQINQVLDILLLRQRPSTTPISTSQQIINQESIQPDLRPLVILDVRQARNVVKVCDMLYPLSRLLV